MNSQYVVEPMTLEDIPPVVAIERDAFGDHWPPSAFRHELTENRLAHYLVVREAGPESKIQNPKSKMDGSAPVVGYVGLWMAPDQAHITTIAVRRDCRGLGLGELLLQEALGLAHRLGASEVTLEVRVSNGVAQSLYRKYGFAEVGVRRGYYSDNREDAFLFTLNDLALPRYRRRLRGLRRRLQARLATL